MDYEDKCERERYIFFFYNFINRFPLLYINILYCEFRQYKKIYLLEAEIKNLKEELAMQQQKLFHHQEEMKKMFTKTQILETEDWQSVEWSTEDISSALTLHAAEPRAYNTLLKKNYPLPSFSTLKSWAPKMRLQNNG